MKINEVFLRGRVLKKPMIAKNEHGEPVLAICTLDTVRGFREVGDKLSYLQHNYPIIMSREKEHIEMIGTLQENDIVSVSGVLSTTLAQKTRFCPNEDCPGNENGLSRFKTPYLTLYVTPKHIELLKSYGFITVDKTDLSETNQIRIREAKKLIQQANDDIVAHREVSNRVLAFGVLLKDPRYITTKSKLKIAQYPIAMNRKFLIRTDDPSIKTDYPWVKTYGDNAIDDKLFLERQSEVVLDGFLHTRKTHPEIKCPCCGRKWKIDETSTEIVPYATEYVANFKTKEDVEAEKTMTIEEAKARLFGGDTTDTIDTDEPYDDDYN